MSGLSSPGNRAWSQVQTPFYTRLCLGSFVMVAAGNYCMGQGDCSVSWPVVPVLEAQLVSFLMRFSPPKPPSCRLIVAPSPCTELGPHLPFRGLQIYHSYCSIFLTEFLKSVCFQYISSHAFPELLEFLRWQFSPIAFRFFLFHSEFWWCPAYIIWYWSHVL